MNVSLLRKPPRWEESFFKDKFTLYSKNGSHQYEQTMKMWICGPPAMQETFDRAAEDLGVFAGKGVVQIL